MTCVLDHERANVCGLCWRVFRQRRAEVRALIDAQKRAYVGSLDDDDTPKAKRTAYEDDFSKSTFGAELVTVTTTVGLPDSDAEAEDGSSTDGSGEETGAGAGEGEKPKAGGKHKRIVAMVGKTLEETAELVRKANEREAARQQEESVMAKVRRKKMQAKKEKLNKVRRSRNKAIRSGKGGKAAGKKRHRK